MSPWETVQSPRMRFCLALFIGLCLTLCWVASPRQAHAADADFGTISGRVIFAGDIPKLKPITTTKDMAICGPTVPDESLLVDAETKGVANVFVYLYKAKSVHPQREKSAQKDVVLDQKGCRYVPKALFLRADQTLRLKSQDACAHNVHTYPLRGAAMNVIIPANQPDGLAANPQIPEGLPFPVKCDIHPWMQAHLLVLDHPYAAITDSKGQFQIADLPAGSHTFRIWHERPGYLNREYSVTVTGGKALDLGKISFTAQQFESK